MAIIDTNKMKKPFINDRDETVSIGLKLPIKLDNGFDASTTTTIDATTQNLKSLLSTEVGERVMQPSLGIKLKKFLFEQFSEDMILNIQDTIVQTVKNWLPFVIINDIKVEAINSSTGDFNHVLKVSVNFSLKKDPTSTESIQIKVGE